MNNFCLVLLYLLMTILGALGSFGLKKAVCGLSSVWELPFRWAFYFGGGSYFVSALLNILLLRYINYTILLPLTSLTYCWSMLLAKFFFQEKITKLKIFGLLFIFLGILLLMMH